MPNISPTEARSVINKHRMVFELGLHYGDRSILSVQPSFHCDEDVAYRLGVFVGANGGVA